MSSFDLVLPGLPIPVILGGEGTRRQLALRWFPIFECSRWTLSSIRSRLVSILIGHIQAAQS